MSIATFPAQVAHISLGDLLRCERESHEGHTQEYCAATIRYTRRQWINWETGKSQPSMDALLAILRLYPDLKERVISRIGTGNG